MPRMKDHYIKFVRPKLMEEFGIKNLHDVPRLQKIVLNVGVGKAIQEPKILEAAQKELCAITGQYAVITQAKSSSPTSSCAKA